MVMKELDESINVLNKPLLLLILDLSILNKNTVHRACSIDQIQ